ncbi:hypothetical protein [Streptomyces spectabilis]|uniref:Uncharacterized protein n=1 Tax=Streptomyces spectabilis TaxID=68270 RepID=A0A7W8F0L0_STRST|nr:hypothetical protein [Streptomyces spectabilis]MBB5109855.1 hypothetical protein [Streptomyces spectabilis]GGV55829.1 hypothetical protein GCM10010245_88550 [Streptomyces spectabilis]
MTAATAQPRRSPPPRYRNTTGGGPARTVGLQRQSPSRIQRLRPHFSHAALPQPRLPTRAPQPSARPFSAATPVPPAPTLQVAQAERARPWLRSPFHTPTALASATPRPDPTR